MDSTSTTIFNALNPIVWVITIVGSSEGENVLTNGTGFSVSMDGLIMTCHHIFVNINIANIYVRRLLENDCFSEATFVCIRPSWDLTLLQVQGATGCTGPSGRLASNGSLYAGQYLFHIGHPCGFVGSCLTGHVSYPCVEDVLIPTDHQMCSQYDSTALTRTPNYRVLGDILNVAEFHRLIVAKKKLEDYEKILHPLVPVIQCTGFVSGPGGSGGPVFNSEGEVVGMMILESGGYEISIHVTLLREFLNIALQEREERLHDDAKNLGRTSISGESSSINRGKRKK